MRFRLTLRSLRIVSASASVEVTVKSDLRRSFCRSSRVAPFFIASATVEECLYNL